MLLIPLPLCKAVIMSQPTYIFGRYVIELVPVNDYFHIEIWLDDRKLWAEEYDQKHMENFLYIIERLAQW
jgi:hypothetical protein